MGKEGERTAWTAAEELRRDNLILVLKDIIPLTLTEWQRQCQANPNPEATQSHSHSPRSFHGLPKDYHLRRREKMGRHMVHGKK